MTLPSTHMKDTLVVDGFTFGTSSQWSIWIGKQPDAPDRCITIYDTPGRAPDPKWLLDYPTVQVRVRGGEQDYAVAGLKAKEIQNRLVGRESYNAPDTLGDRIVSIVALGDVAFDGWGQKDRPEFVFNLSLIIEPSATTPNTNREPLPGI